MTTQEEMLKELKSQEQTTLGEVKVTITVKNLTVEDILTMKGTTRTDAYPFLKGYSSTITNNCLR